MDNGIRMGEQVSLSSLYLSDKTEEGHRLDAILWQDEKTGLWQYQNGNDLGLVDEADNETPVTVQHTLRLPHGNVVAIVDLGEGCNSVGTLADGTPDGTTFPEVYAQLLEWDASGSPIDPKASK